MRPVVFDGCAGWLHAGEGRHGVVLCNPFGYDALCTHRGWRRLAERLAAAGMPVLRFDYPGTGDSAGSEEERGRVDAWLASIAAAIRYLRSSTGVERVSLCGLRLGATLAALAAQRSGEVESLVLLSPALSGKNYLRELRAHRQSWLSTPDGINAQPIAEGTAYVEAFGFGVHGDDIAQLAAIDLRRDTTAPASRVMMLDASDRARAGALVDHYAAHGVAVERRAFDEADRFLIEALYSVEPVEAFSAVAEWLAALPEAKRDACDAHGAHDTHDTHDTASHAALPAAGREEEDPEQPLLPLPEAQAVERPVVFGAYFGVHCQPDTPRAEAPAVLFINTGASHHIGDGRIFVLFARRLAALGIASLRMDLGGLGDSTPAAQSVTLDTIYAPQSCADAMAGADWLVAQGHRQVVTFGVCGGAFVGLHACAHHPQMTACFGVNLQKFIWDGEARSPGTAGLASSRVLRRSALRLDKWKRVLRGETSLLRVLRGLSQRGARSVLLRVAERIEQVTGLSLVRNEAVGLLQKLERKGVDVHLVYGEYDLGVDELKIQFGARLRALRRFSRVRVLTLPTLDHALFTREAREAAMADAQAWLLERCVASPAASGHHGAERPAGAPVGGVLGNAP